MVIWSMIVNDNGNGGGDDTEGDGNGNTLLDNEVQRRLNPPITHTHTRTHTRARAFHVDTSMHQDIAAAVRSIESMLGWFADPIWGRPDGSYDYPETMQRLLGDALPRFSLKEKELLKVF
jgi:hypothetical protein